MTLYDIIKPASNHLLNIHRLGFRLPDIRYLHLYREYQGLSQKGVKKTYIIIMLAEKYRISERKVWQIVRLYGKRIDAPLLQSLYEAGADVDNGK